MVQPFIGRFGKPITHEIRLCSFQPDRMPSRWAPYRESIMNEPPHERSIRSFDPEGFCFPPEDLLYWREVRVAEVPETKSVFKPQFLHNGLRVGRISPRLRNCVHVTEPPNVARFGRMYLPEILLLGQVHPVFYRLDSLLFEARARLGR